MRKANIFGDLLIATLVFSLVIVSLVVIPASPGQLFQSYGFFGTNTLNESIQTNNITELSSELQCDLNPDSSYCSQSEGAGSTIGDILNLILKNSWGAIVTLGKTAGYVYDLAGDITSNLGIPQEITDIFIAMIVITLAITVLIIIFTRSDT